MAEIVSPTTSGPPPLRKSTPDMSEEDELETSTHSQVLHQRMKTDRATMTRPEEDRRRRTIIVEKKKGSYGFTLQSYGIHYKKEQEVEMITYVDFVEYDGPAYRAGMRQGDVILSINGTDMEKADHKTLVTFIKDCDTRMRMVVLFEDCVRKVELHMRYLHLQTVLQGKMSELERVCLRERELLEGKWKTHSLPARKKAADANVEISDSLGNRPISTEDVGALGKQQQHHQKNHCMAPPPTQMMLAYRYLDPHCRYILRPSASTSSGEYLISIAPANHPNTQQRCKSQQYLRRVPSSENNTTASSLPEDSTPKREQKGKSARHCHGHSCNPCHFGRSPKGNNGDNVSLDAYDLASTCCDAQCVPIRRRSRHHSKDQHHQHKHKHRSKESKERHHQQQRVPQAQAPAPPPQFANHPPRYYDHLSAGLASHCSLHSCTSSEFKGSVTSYTTSLSTDTLWEPHSERQHSVKSAAPRTSVSYYAPPAQHQGFPTRVYPHAAQIQPVSGYGYAVQKPKSWDNLTTKAIGGCGFGYGYLDTVAPKAMTTSAHQVPQRHSMPRKMTPAYERYTTFPDVENYAPPPSQFVQQTTTTTTTISLMGPAAICDCLDGGAGSKVATAKITPGYYSSLPPRAHDSATVAPATTVAEITRL
ncbi:PDZ domain-containing protein [Sergentomyia squamirostris]